MATEEVMNEPYFAFADKSAAESRLQGFFDTCGLAVAEGRIKDVVDVGLLSTLLYELTMSLALEPDGAHDGFTAAYHGDIYPDEEFSEFMQCPPVPSGTEMQLPVTEAGMFHVVVVNPDKSDSFYVTDQGDPLSLPEAVETIKLIDEKVQYLLLPAKDEGIEPFDEAQVVAGDVRIGTKCAPAGENVEAIDQSRKLPVTEIELPEIAAGKFHVAFLDVDRSQSFYLNDHAEPVSLTDAFELIKAIDRPLDYILVPAKTDEGMALKDAQSSVLRWLEQEVSQVGDLDRDLRDE